ncbi:MAG: ABC transporter permease [Candidatus Krumholzibacteriota bacterium]|nr:ABC transporter permease [Candidatus Krumholzibacteriota bacterium]
MIKFVLRRIILLVPILLGVVTVTFILMYVIPGDPVLALVGERYDEETLEAKRRELGLDQPLFKQYLGYLGRVSRMDLGRSFITGRPVTESIAERFPRTLTLALSAMLLAVSGGILAGALAAWGRFPWLGRSMMTLSLVGVSIPVFWLGLLLIFLFSIKLSLLPPSGYGGGSWRYLILPAITLSFASLATIARVTRSGFLDTGGEDFVRTARAKGLGESKVLGKHILRNALIPVVTIVGTDFGSYLSGSVLTESIFGWPGLGRFIVQAILKRDFPVIQGSILFMAVLFVIVNLLVDLSYGIIDPRVRRMGGAS